MTPPDEVLPAAQVDPQSDRPGGVAALGRLGWGDPLAAEAIRHDLHRLANSAAATVSPAGANESDQPADTASQIDQVEWRPIVAGHGRAYEQFAPRTLIQKLAVDLTHARDRLRSADWPDRAAMLRVTALLAALLAGAVSELGDPATSRRWWHTATQSADACPDPRSRDHAEIRLHTALRLVRHHDRTRGIAYARSTIDTLAAPQHTASILEAARQVLAALTPEERQYPDVAEFRASITAASRSCHL